MRAEDECIFSIKEVRGFNFASNVIYSQFKIILINATKYMRMHVVVKGIVKLKGAATANMKCLANKVDQINTRPLCLIRQY